MKLFGRWIFALLAWVIAGWTSAALASHFAGAPNAGMEFLLWSPIAACLLTLGGLAIEAVGEVARRPQRGAMQLARALQWSGVLGMSLRSLWTFYNWDGYFYLPAACLLAMSLWRRRAAAASAAA